MGKKTTTKFICFRSPNDHGGTRTHNLPLRRRAPYPLGHATWLDDRQRATNNQTMHDLHHCHVPLRQSPPWQNMELSHPVSTRAAHDGQSSNTQYSSFQRHSPLLRGFPSLHCSYQVDNLTFWHSDASSPSHKPIPRSHKSMLAQNNTLHQSARPHSGTDHTKSSFLHCPCIPLSTVS
jgi:hypothetical protein